ncbi:arylsulfatase [Flexibacterium corallicola]|uniref:arylsulfatase n=1 Tax=Flexibacterium corallicola TaxID=3037259 RepID=UPI00286F89CC|nr:arylsulfatase [Pseudovibrio sp. M1P-2-3]
MKLHSWTVSAFIAASTLCLGSATTLAQQNKQPDKKPNIVVIMTDDVSWDNVGVYSQGVKSIKTPNIDKLAAEGMRFTDYYSQPSCTAGRSAFITGQLPIRTGLYAILLPGSPGGIQASDPTMAKFLQQEGYVTAQFGKNHLGDLNEYLPTVHGFDEFWGYLYAPDFLSFEYQADWPKNQPEFNNQFGPRQLIYSWAQEKDDPTIDPRWGRVGKQKIKNDGPAPVERRKKLDEEITKHTVDFIERSAKADKPFFVWMNTQRAHVFTYLSDKYQAMLDADTGLQDVIMREVDDNVGVVLKTLDDLKIADNTIVIFTSDNGPQTITWPDGGTTPFRGSKGTTWEGGFRVPTIIRWPGHVPAGVVENGVFDATDWMPTLVAAAGGPSDLVSQLQLGYKDYKVHLDGYNQLDLITGKGKSARNEVFLYQGNDLQAIRFQDWKAHLIIQPEGWFGPKVKLEVPQMYNLRRDPWEKDVEESGMHVKWDMERVWMVVPFQLLINLHQQSFNNFPARKQEGGLQPPNIKYVPVENLPTHPPSSSSSAPANTSAPAQSTPPPANK